MTRREIPAVAAAVALTLLLALPVVAPRTQPTARAASYHVQYHIILISPQRVRHTYGPYYLGPYGNWSTAVSVRNWVNAQPIRNGYYGWRYYYIARIP